MYHSQPWFNLNVPWPARVYKICTLEFGFEVRWFHGTSIKYILPMLAYSFQVRDGQYYPQKKNSQAVKKGAALKSLGEKSCEIKSGSQQMAAMMNFFLWISLLFAIASSKASLWLTLIIPLTFIPLLQESLKTAWLYEELNFDCTNDSLADSTQTRNGRYPTLRNIPL